MERLLEILPYSRIRWYETSIPEVIWNRYKKNVLLVLLFNLKSMFWWYSLKCFCFLREPQNWEKYTLKTKENVIGSSEFHKDDYVYWRTLRKKFFFNQGCPQKMSKNQQIICVHVLKKSFKIFKMVLYIIQINLSVADTIGTKKIVRYKEVSDR